MIIGDFWLARENLPFALAGGLVLGVLLLELLSLLVGGSLAGLLDGLDADADFDLDVDGPEAPALAWLGFGVIPLFALIVVALTVFCLGGYAIQGAAESLTSRLLPMIVAGPLALVPTLALTGRLARVLGRTLFKDESDAVGADDLLGATATITLGATSAGRPTQAKVVDSRGLTHYVLVEPLNPEATFALGAEVVLVERQGARYLVSGASADELFDSLSLSSSTPSTPS